MRRIVLVAVGLLWGWSAAEAVEPGQWKIIVELDDSSRFVGEPVTESLRWEVAGQEERVDPAADSRWGVVGPYERLSVLLAEMLRSGARAVDVGRRSAIATTAAPVTDDPIAAVADAMAREGFDPVVFRHKGDAAEIVLQTCPFVAAAEADPATVCALHLGIAEGVAEATGGRLRIDRLVPHDPRRANCRLHVHVEDGDGDV